MLGRNIALALVLCLTTFLSSMTFAAAPVVEPTGMWSGKIKDLSLRKLAPKSGFIADAETWKKLWRAWRPDEDLPKLDFAKGLILVGTVPGPNLVSMRPTIDDSGNVRFTVAETEIAGPGFGYKLIGISRNGVKTVNGKALIDKKPAVEDSITVTILGTLRTGIVAIGGETTGTTITAKGITWELDLGKNAAMRKAAEKFNGKKVIVQGSLERRRGVEIKERWIVTVTGLQAVGDAGVGGGQAFAQDAVLKTLWKSSAHVLHVKVLGIQGGEQDEDGVSEWAAKCRVLKAYKNGFSAGKTVRFRFQRFEFKNDPKTKKPIKEVFKVQKKKEYVIFLKGTSGGVRFESDDKLFVAHNLTDRWLGVQPYCVYLDAKLYRNEKPKVLDRRYFPIGVGYKWVYASGNGDVVFEVVGKEKVGKNDCFVVERSIGKHKLKFYVSVSDTGVRIHRVGDEIYEPPFLQFAFPTKANENWTSKGKLGGSNFKYECVNHGIGDVTVPLGQLSAFHVGNYSDAGNAHYRLVKGIGVVSIYQKKSDKHDPIPGPFTWRLKKFVKPKKQDARKPATKLPNLLNHLWRNRRHRRSVAARTVDPVAWQTAGRHQDRGREHPNLHSNHDLRADEPAADRDHVANSVLIQINVTMFQREARYFR